MKIAIAGCGIAGATAGYLLSSQGHDVTLFEQANQCGPMGAGILIQPIGQTILKSLGIYEDIYRQSAQLNSVEAFKQSGKHLVRLEYQHLRSDLYGLGVHRGFLFNSLLTLAKQAGTEIRENSHVVNYHVSNSGVSLELDSHGQTELFDFMIATNGAHSGLRHVSGIKHSTIEYEYGALWATGACPAVTDKLLQIVEGTQKIIGLLPIGNNECSFFWGLTAKQFKNLQQKGIDDWKKNVLRLCPLSEELVTSWTSFEDLIFTTYCSVSMGSCWSDRIVFLGDAAHPMSPHLGQGANFALEDAWIFSECLKQESDFRSTCLQYESLRKNKIRFYQQITALLTPFFQSDGVIKGWGRDIALPIMCQIPIIRGQMLKTLCGFKTSWLRSQMSDKS